MNNRFFLFLASLLFFGAFVMKAPAQEHWTSAQQKAAIIQAQKKVNYNESAVAPYTLEDPLLFADGRKVSRKKQWPERRQEILDIFQREMYGRMPPASDIYVETLEEGSTLAGFGTRRQLRMWFRPDKTGPKVDSLIITPNHVQGPVPVILLLNYGGNHEVSNSLRFHKTRDEVASCPLALGVSL